MVKITTHYDNLGVSRSAQPEVIRAAYKALAKKYHPDRNPNNPDAERIMKIINTAYQVLINPARRAEHDRWIAEQEAKINIDSYNHKNHNQSNQSANNQEHYSYTQNNANQPIRSSRSNWMKKDDKNKYNGISKPSFWSIHSRLRRTKFATLALPSLLIWMIFRAAAENAIASTNNYIFSELLFITIIELLPFFFLVFLSVKRLHDCNYKGWWILIPFVILAIFFVPPTKGSNRFGRDPRKYYFDENTKLEKDYSFFYIIAISISINLGLISDLIDSQNSTINTETDAYQQLSQNALKISTSQNNTSNNADTKPNLNLAKSQYDEAVANINGIWNSLHPSVQDFCETNSERLIKTGKLNVPLMAKLKARITTPPRLIAIYVKYPN